MKVVRFAVTLQKAAEEAFMGPILDLVAV